MFVWDINPEIFKLGPLAPRYYGLLFGLGFYVGFLIMRRIFREEGHHEEELQSLLLYMMIGTIVGARLGHCLFYEPLYYLSNPLEILKVWHGGLASHGGTIGVLISCYLFRKKHPQHSYLWLADRLAIGTAFTAGCIRVGNFFNSEIIGKPTELPWGIVFKSHSPVPRHPAMLYEALAYFLLFIVLYFLYRRWKANTPQGSLLGILLVWVFSARVGIEFVKENQVAFENHMLFNMGQILSVPFILIGVLFLTGKIQGVMPFLVEAQAKNPKKQKSSPKPKKRK